MFWGVGMIGPAPEGGEEPEEIETKLGDSAKYADPAVWFDFGCHVTPNPGPLLIMGSK